MNKRIIEEEGDLIFKYFYVYNKKNDDIEVKDLVKGRVSFTSHL